jgi:hypothetical protein
VLGELHEAKDVLRVLGMGLDDIIDGFIELI